MINDKLKIICSTIPQYVQLVAVSKYQPVEALQQAYNAGQRAFGENRPQEMKTKQPLMPTDVEWHFIGNLQTNKIKYIISYVHLIHSVSSYRLLQEINKEAAKNGRIVNCLLEFHIAQEDSKHGFSLDEAETMLQLPEFDELKNIHVKGVMGMATLIDNELQIRNEFKSLKNIFDTLKQKYFASNADFKEISMGMSGDYKIAIEEGSTIVRIGSAIFA